MKIAVLGWGSLIWDMEREFSVVYSEWLSDGPILPIEFARVSSKYPLTLVILEGSKNVRTLWNIVSANSLNVAIQSLSSREGLPSTKNISFIDCLNNTSSTTINSSHESILKQWCIEQKCDALIWTGLTSNFTKKTSKVLNIENVLYYLNNLTLDRKFLAKEYIFSAPSQIQTGFRKQIEEFIKEISH